MDEDVIELYDTFNIKFCPEDLIFGDFNSQPIPSTYYHFTKYYDDNFTSLTDNKGVEDEVV